MGMCLNFKKISQPISLSCFDFGCESNVKVISSSIDVILRGHKKNTLYKYIMKFNGNFLKVLINNKNID
jgi:hypothetical protein